jgi:hypothetical protein
MPTAGWGKEKAARPPEQGGALTFGCKGFPYNATAPFDLSLDFDASQAESGADITP